MSKGGAERAVVVSALVVAAVYAYRVITEGHSTAPGGGAKQLAGVGQPPNLGRFITGWGFSFLVIAILASSAPSLGGSVAILVATGDVLANMGQVAADVNKKTAAQKPGTARQGAAVGTAVGSLRGVK
jgi:hypothetical protein